MGLGLVRGSGARGRSATMVIVVEVWECWRKKLALALARRLPFGSLSAKENVQSSLLQDVENFSCSQAGKGQIRD